MQNTIAHLSTSTFIRKFAVNFSYYVLTALICETITFYKCDNRYRDILDNRDNFVVNIEIYFLTLSHTSNIIIYILVITNFLVVY